MKFFRMIIAVGVCLLPSILFPTKVFQAFDSDILVHFPEDWALEKKSSINAALVESPEKLDNKYPLATVDFSIDDLGPQKDLNSIFLETTTNIFNSYPDLETFDYQRNDNDSFSISYPMTLDSQEIYAIIYKHIKQKKVCTLTCLVFDDYLNEYETIFENIEGSLHLASEIPEIETTSNTAYGLDNE